jgi:hypothetical protein
VAATGAMRKPPSWTPVGWTQRGCAPVGGTVTPVSGAVSPISGSISADYHAAAGPL